MRWKSLLAAAEVPPGRSVVRAQWQRRSYSVWLVVEMALGLVYPKGRCSRPRIGGGDKVSRSSLVVEAVHAAVV